MDQLRSEIQLLQSGDIGSIPRWKERVSRLKEEKELKNMMKIASKEF